MPTTYTLGDWTTIVTGTISGDPAQWAIVGADGIVCEVLSVNPADAALIAQAPALMGALQALLALCDRHLPIEELTRDECSTIGNARRTARAAIAAATTQE